ncbi:phasin family protein [Azomonas macrocytogenes]|uniref:Phasin family protein n=1 Tax=Azomonas macrocytogenes TaxID=69962 RepID=A0A839T647_AZOMA|nr:phasin family protein [Azomonas macrocytogenes]MBB3104892.1 phasin family protein [Azomonas macrocytogenes]
MSFFDSEKLHSAQQANFDLLQQISSKVFEGVEQLGQLQLKTLRASSDDQFEIFRKLLSARDPQAFTELQASFTQPSAQAERLLEFNRQVYELISGTQAEVAKLTERQIEASAKQTQELVDVIARNAPLGAEPVVAVFKSALESVGTVYESAQKAARQAAEITENGIAAAAQAAREASNSTEESYHQQ